MSDATIRESSGGPDASPTTRDNAAAATVREPAAAAATVREGQTSTGGGSRSSDAGGSTGTGGGSFLRLPEGLAVRYRIERELPTVMTALPETIKGLFKLEIIHC
ncbi:hypothetical protein [Pannonibacter sp.]|uniref:hypothetical protein n=1 Tax=Pannonibacter sp. TaxID=1906786 RepID=UPI003F6EEF73